MRKKSVFVKIRYFLLFLILLIVSCSNSKLSNNKSKTKISVDVFNDFNNKRVDDLKGFFKYSGEFVKSDSNKSYGFTLLLDAISGDSTLYGFIEVTGLHSTDWIIKSGVKIVGLDSKQIDYTCNNTCNLIDNSNNDKYWAIINKYDSNTDKIDIFKAYRLDFKKCEFVEIDMSKIKCEIMQGED